MKIPSEVVWKTQNNKFQIDLYRRISFRAHWFFFTSVTFLWTACKKKGNVRRNHFCSSAMERKKLQNVRPLGVSIAVGDSGCFQWSGGMGNGRICSFFSHQRSSVATINCYVIFSKLYPVVLGLWFGGCKWSLAICIPGVFVNSFLLMKYRYNLFTKKIKST